MTVKFGMNDHSYQAFRQGKIGAVIAAKPAEIMDVNPGAVQDAFRQPENVAILERLGLVAYAETPEWFTTLIQKEIKVWKAVIEDLGIKPE